MAKTIRHSLKLLKSYGYTLPVITTEMYKNLQSEISLRIEYEDIGNTYEDITECILCILL